MADPCVEPIAMHSQFLGQAKHRPLLLKFCLGLELFREGDVAPRSAHLASQSRGDASTPGRTEALHRSTLRHRSIAIPRCASGQQALNKVVVVLAVGLTQERGMYSQRPHGTAHPHHGGLHDIGLGTADDHTPHETAHQLFFLCRLQAPLPPEVGQCTSQITQVRLHLERETWRGLTPEALGRFTSVFHGL